MFKINYTPFLIMPNYSFFPLFLYNFAKIIVFSQYSTARIFIMNSRILFFLFIWITAATQTDAFNTVVDSLWVRQHYNKREVMIPMRDGVRLFTVIYEPKNHEVCHPILMNRTCYGVGPYGDEWIRLERPTWALYAQDEYILVFQDVRGKNFSEGVFEDLRPFITDKKTVNDIDEASDTYDTVEWLINNTCSNNRVGVFGISYPGFYATAAALAKHPAIKAVSPQAPVTDWYRGDDTHHNGALFILDMFDFSYWFQFINNAHLWKGEYHLLPTDNPTEIVKTDAYSDYLKMGPVRNFTALLGDSCKFWSDMVKHPDIDQWWEERNIAYHCKEIKPAVMVVGGLFDAEDCYGAFTTYNAIKRQSPDTELLLVEGPWSHGTWSRGADGSLGDIWFGKEADMFYYLENIEFPFFSYYLNNKGEKPMTGALVWQTGENKWIEYEKGWESDCSKTPFYLQHGGGLGNLMPSDSTTDYVSDPMHPVPFIGFPVRNRPTSYMTADQRFAQNRTDVATFTTPTLDKPIAVDGAVEAELFVQISSTDADFIVKLIDVFPDDFEYSDEINYSDRWTRNHAIMAGYQMLVRMEVMRGKYRECMELDSIAFNATSHDALRQYEFNPSKPMPFVPQQTTKVRIKLPDVAHTFMPGHKMMVQIQSSCFPLIDRNPQKFCNIYECEENDFQKATVRILHSKDNPSRIWLPINRHITSGE